MEPFIIASFTYCRFLEMCFETVVIFSKGAFKLLQRRSRWEGFHV